MRYGRAHVNGGYRPVVAKEGPKWTQVVYLDGTTVKVRKVKGRLVYQPLRGYNLRLLAKRMLRQKNIFGTKMLVTRRARKILEEAKA